MQQRIDALERRLEQLLQSGVPAGGAAGGTPGGAAAGGSSRAGGARGGSFGTRSAGSGSSAIAKVKLEPFVEARQGEAAGRVKARWPEVLQRVKDTRISVHAWLIDGEPVSAADDGILLAFKNTMHRETTEKPANREIIERVLQELFGRPLRFFTVMQKEWQAAEGAPVSEAETLQLTPEDDPAGSGKPEWVEEAIHMFGEELVVIVDEE